VPRGPDFRRVLVLDILLPFLTAFVLQRQGVPALGAYAAAALFPSFSILLAFVQRRAVDIIGIGVLLGIGSGLTLGIATADPRFGLVRAAPGFALFGLACLVSLATARPLMFYVARAFVAQGDPQRVAAWNARRGLPRFQRAMRRVTTVWGASALGEACLAIAAAFLLPGQIALIVEPVIAFGIIAALLAWTRAFQRNAPPVET